MRHGATQHDQLGIDDVHHVRQDPPQQVAQLLQQCQGPGVAGGAGLGCLLVATGRHGPFGQLLDDRAFGEVGLQATAVAAAAGSPSRHGGYVPHLAGEAAGPTLQPLAQVERSADAGVPRDDHEVAGLLGAAEQLLGQGSRLGVVVDRHGHRP